MPLDLALSDLNHLDRIRDALSRNDPRGQFTALGMDRLTIADDAVDGLVAAVERQLGRAGRPATPETRIRLVADAVTIRRDGRDLKADVFAALAERFAVERVTLDDGHPALHADEAQQDRAAELCVGADAIARTAGIGLLDTQAALQRLERSGIVERTSDGWRLRDVNAPYSPAENAEVPTMNP